MESTHQDFVAINNAPQIDVTLTTTVSGILTKDGTAYYVPGMPLILDKMAKETLDDYTDEQFYADLKKSKKALDRMARQAEREYKRGKTREFPVGGKD